VEGEKSVCFRPWWGGLDEAALLADLKFKKQAGSSTPPHLILNLRSFWLVGPSAPLGRLRI
jgi:hypothetical protein